MSLFISKLFKRSFSQPLLRVSVNTFSTSSSISFYPSVEKDSPLIFTDWMQTKYGSVQFYNIEMEAYYYQIINDLVKYYSYSEKDAIVETGNLSFFHIDRFDMVKAGIVTQDCPFYYATQLALGDRLSEWKHHTSEPEDYEYCTEFKLLIADATKYSYEYCKEKFDKLISGNYESEINNLFYGVQVTSLVPLKEGLKMDVNLDFDCTRNESYYITNDFKQAKLWSNRKIRHKSNTPMVTVWELDVEKVKKEYKWKVLDDYEEWVEFVRLSRQGKNEHSYDIVEGPFVLNSEVCNNGDEKCLMPCGHQIAVCTEAVGKELQYFNSGVV